MSDFDDIINERRPKSSEAQPGAGRGNLEAAQTVIEGCFSAIRQDIGQEPILHSEQSLKSIEQSALFEWASKNNLFLDLQAFSGRWNAQGQMRGREHFVYFDELTNLWIKKNILTYHTTYRQYFLRLSLHNQIFPESPYKLIGFIREEPSLFPVVSQQDIQSTSGAAHEQVAEMMRLIGFDPVPKTNDAYLSKDGSIEIKDLHDQNALVTHSGKISVIDPLIRILDESKAELWLKERGMSI